MDDFSVVGCVHIAQRLYVGHDSLYLLDSSCGAHPKTFLGLTDALALDFFDLYDGVVSLLSPLKLLIEEVKHGEVQTPQVVPPGEVNVVVRVQRGERHSASEVSALALRHRLVVCAKVLFGQAKIDDEDAGVLRAKHEVGRLDVPVDEARLVDFLHGDDHLHEDLDGDLQIVPLF